LNLADCYERQGKIASAWTSYKATLELAKRTQRPDRVEIAANKLRELAPRVSNLTLTLSSPGPRDLSVVVDGVEVGVAGIGAPLAVDAGRHVVVVTVPQGGRSEQQVELAEGESRALELSLPAAPRVHDDESKRRGGGPAAPAGEPAANWAYVLGGTLMGLGAGSLAAGLGTGIRALALGAEVEQECPDHLCSRAGFAAYEEADTHATASNVTLAVGAGLVVAGLGFVLAGTSFGERTATVAIRPNGTVEATLSF
jgi:hypothetical protein